MFSYRYSVSFFEKVGELILIAAAILSLIICAIGIYIGGHFCYSLMHMLHVGVFNMEGIWPYIFLIPLIHFDNIVLHNTIHCVKFFWSEVVLELIECFA